MFVQRAQQFPRLCRPALVASSRVVYESDLIGGTGVS
jgi:hypothetical protein